MWLIRPVEKFVFESKTWVFLSVTWLLALAKSGAWWFPGLPLYQPVASDPFAANTAADYLTYNWLGGWIAHVLGLDSGQKFTLFLLICTIAFTAATWALLLVSLPPAPGRCAVTIFTVLPVFATPYFWVGMDGLTLLVLTGVVAARKRWYLVGPLGVLLGMQHFEQAIVAAILLLGALGVGHLVKVPQQFPAISAAVLTSGVVSGRLVLEWIFARNHMQPPTRLDWLAHNRAILVDLAILHPQAIVWSVLGLGWLILLRHLDLGWKAAPMALAVAGGLGLVFLTADESRVAAIVLFPTIAICWLLNTDFLESLRRTELAGLALLWLAIPHLWIWGGLPQSSTLSYDLAYLLHEWRGWLPDLVPPDRYQWPFVLDSWITTS